jgi:hypothetical protein
VGDPECGFPLGFLQLCGPLWFSNADVWHDILCKHIGPLSHCSLSQVYREVGLEAIGPNQVALGSMAPVAPLVSDFAPSSTSLTIHWHFSVVDNQPSAFIETYWEINSLRVYIPWDLLVQFLQYMCGMVQYHWYRRSGSRSKRHITVFHNQFDSRVVCWKNKVIKHWRSRGAGRSKILITTWLLYSIHTTVHHTTREQLSIDRLSFYREIHDPIAF